MKTYNFGIVGAGLIADFHARAIADLPNAKLIACCDPAIDRAKALAVEHSCKAFAGFEEMLELDEIDIVTIATPSGLHGTPAIAAAKAGKHVICEKPLEITLEKTDAVIAAHKEAGTFLGGVFQNRFNDAMTPLRNAIKSKRFGTITYAGVYVPWWRTDEYYKGSWHGTWNLDGGGALMNQSIHMIDMLCDLMPPVEVVAAFADHIGHPQIQAEDTSVAALKFTGGAMGIIYGTSASWPGQYKRFEITGTKGTVVYLEDSLTTWQFADEEPADEKVRKQFGQIAQTGGGKADPAAIAHDNHTKNFAAFLDALDGKTSLELDGAEARKAVALILAIYESAKEGKLVKL